MTADPRAVFTALVARAREQGDRQAWAEAAQSWQQAATVAIRSEAVEAAWQALLAAGEAWRREDHPLHARKALEVALRLPHSPDQEELVTARMAGVLADLGHGELALELCAKASTASGQGRAMLLDTWIGLCMGFGRVALAPSLLQELRGLPGAAIAVGFRAGQLARLAGALEVADQHFRAVMAQLDGVAGAEAGVAAARMELGELDALRGHTAPAVEAYAAGRALHLNAGRRALAFRCEAGRTRALVEGGLEALTARLDEGIAFARERRLATLEVDLTIPRGMALSSSDPSSARAALVWAAERADALGAPLRAGRARLERALRVEVLPSVQVGLLGQAVPLLAEDHALHQRALEALAVAG